MKNFVIQLKLMTKRKTFIITLSAVMILSILFFLLNCISKWNLDLNNVWAAKYYYLGSYFVGDVLSHIYTIIFPFVSVIPFADTFFEEREKRTAEFCMARISNRSYYFSKLFAVFCSCVIIAAAPLLINMLLNFIAFPLDSTATYTNFSYAYAGVFTNYAGKYVFKSLFLKNIYLYNLLHLSLAALFSGLAATAVYQLSYFYKKSRIMLLCSFFIVYTFLEILFGSFELDEFCASTYIFGAQPVVNQSARGMAVVFACMAAAAVLPALFARKRINDFYE